MVRRTEPITPRTPEENRPSDAAIQAVLVSLIRHRRERLAAEAEAKANAEAAAEDTGEEEERSTTDQGEE